MEFADQTLNQTSGFFTASPEPFHIFWFIVAFVLNFILCRYISIKLVQGGYITKHPMVLCANKKGQLKYLPNHKVVSEEYKKLFLFWFVPVVGAGSLIALYITCVCAKTLVAIKRTLFLSHI